MHCDGFLEGYSRLSDTTRNNELDCSVSDIETKVEGSRGPNYGADSTYYDIYYEYAVDDQIYTGVIKSQNQSRDIGESLKIKYDPTAPEKSSDVLELSK